MLPAPARAYRQGRYGAAQVTGGKDLVASSGIEILPSSVGQDDMLAETLVSWHRREGRHARRDRCFLAGPRPKDAYAPLDGPPPWAACLASSAW
jgi:hypothetical protein